METRFKISDTMLIFLLGGATKVRFTHVKYGILIAMVAILFWRINKAFIRLMFVSKQLDSPENS